MIFDLIQQRRSVFPPQYNDRPIAKKDIEKILEAANRAPTHRKTEPWRFKVIQGDKKAELGEFLSNTYIDITVKPKQIKAKKLIENPKRAAAIIAICMQRDPNESVPEWEEIAATAMAVQNMWLCCTAMGIGSYWSSPALIEYMDEFLPMNEGEKCLGFFYMGYFDEVLPESNRNPITDKTVWIK
ncbi:nitroreductase family protein [Costertonia aggregata]|uniref:Putative NAD(P)H nitroreductase n=1 Tax=Costertonia aggregata TaxID=343403 RepID=A0A7H9AMJ4_9FLAO|nr:nitroreductase [Costertonia aggregata]QLG44670.1 nitroreductase [Costertonia aggregata]